MLGGTSQGMKRHQIEISKVKGIVISVTLLANISVYLKILCIQECW